MTKWGAWPRRVSVWVTTVPVLLFVWSTVAFADDGSKLSQTPGALSWTNPKDSRGIGVWNYEMSLDRGGVTSPSKVIWSSYIDFYWTVYRSIVVVGIWLIDWVLGFSWLSALATPALTLSSSLTDVVNRFGLPPTLLTIAAAVSVLWMAKGRWALGVVELFTSLFVASLAVGVLANPVEKVVGDQGLIVDSRDFGLQVANRLAHDGKAPQDAAQLRKENSAVLVDTFIRMPAEVLNFGTVLDGGKCEKTYTDTVKGGPYGNESTIRDAVAKCDSALGDVAANPGPGQAVSSLVITPSAFFVLLFAIVLSGAVFLAGLYALYYSIKAIVTLVTGLLPGVARGALWQTIADFTMSLITLVFSIVFLTAYLLLIQGIFSSAKPGGATAMQTFFFVDILLFAGIIVFWRARKSLRRAADGLAKALASRPGPPPERHAATLPERGPGLTKAAAEAAALVVAVRTLLPKIPGKTTTEVKVVEILPARSPRTRPPGGPISGGGGSSPPGGARPAPGQSAPAAGTPARAGRRGVGTDAQDRHRRGFSRGVCLRSGGRAPARVAGCLAGRGLWSGRVRWAAQRGRVRRARPRDRSVDHAERQRGRDHRDRHPVASPAPGRGGGTGGGLAGVTVPQLRQRRSRR